jgi:ATPase subunit of ABC transporter with duplicated ATPase domains
MKFFNILIISVLTFFCVSILNAEIYIWTDEKGVKHYSDHPPENIENYEVQTESQTNQQDEEADKKRTEAEQEQIQDFIKEADENYEKQQKEEKLKAEEAKKNRPPTREEKIAAEKEKLENKIAELEEQPLEYFGSQRNKIARIGYYRYRLEALLEDPDKYFKNPESFEGNIKESE